MIKFCGVVLILLGSFAYTETSDLWFVQGSLIGAFFFFSEALFECSVRLKNFSYVDMTEVVNV